MRLFGTKQPEPTDEDRAAIARLSAVAARFKPEPTTDLTDVAPDPLGGLDAAAAPVEPTPGDDSA